LVRLVAPDRAVAFDAVVVFLAFAAAGLGALADIAFRFSVIPAFGALGILLLCHNEDSAASDP
jgi:hypothetical protein